MADFSWLVPILGLAGFIFGLTNFVVKPYYNEFKKRNDLIKESNLILNEIRSKLSFFDKNDEETCYEVDNTLNQFFTENDTKIKNLIKELSKSQPWWYPKNKKLTNVCDLLDWMVKDFYLLQQEEEDRIRIWSKNVSPFHSKYNQIFIKEKSPNPSITSSPLIAE